VRRHVTLTLALVLFGGLIPTAANAVDPVTCPSVASPDLSFGAPQYIDTARAGGEPVSQVAQDGSIIVSAHAGTTHVYKNPAAAPGSPDFVVGYTNETLNWRSADDGKTWKYIGVAGQAAGPHTVTSSGFSDPDLAMDYSGRIYNTEINLANDSVFSSVDDGQSFPFGNPLAGNGDRPWLTGQDPNEVFLYINSTPFHYLQRSTDGGQTFTTVAGDTPGSTDFPATGKLQNDPLNPHHGLIGPDGVDGITISPDDGATWQEYPGAHLGKSTQFFGAPAVDRAGWAYVAAAGGYGGSSDTTPSGEVTFAYFNRDTTEWNDGKITIPTPAGDALWPWMAAGDDGRVAVVWYQSLAGKPDEFYIYAAYTLNGHGTTVTCSDGSSQFVPPQFSVVNVSGRPIHVGKICLQGTNCNANTSFEAGDRRLGDFFTVNYDLQGNIFIASGDTRLTSLTGSAKPVGNPIFMMQNGGAPLLTEPIPAKPTHALCPLPTCTR
jgi:hypothetical protein